MDSTQPYYIDVLYIPGKTMYGTLPARLEWKADNTLTLTTVEGTKEAPVYKELFNSPVGQIKKVSSMLDELKIFTQSGVFRISVAQHSTPFIAAGGPAGAAVGYGMYKKSGADKWLARLKENGVKVSRLGYGGLLGVAFLGAIVVIGISLGIFFLLEQ
jgi:hypothetical protein